MIAQIVDSLDRKRPQSAVFLYDSKGLGRIAKESDRRNRLPYDHTIEIDRNDG